MLPIQRATLLLALGRWGLVTATSTNINILMPDVTATFPQYTSNVTYRSGDAVAAVTNMSVLAYWYSFEKAFMKAVQPVDLNVGRSFLF